MPILSPQYEDLNITNMESSFYSRRIVLGWGYKIDMYVCVLYIWNNNFLYCMPKFQYKKLSIHLLISY